jgi:GR25 family glycosyltransferase involved in LPS biosynthesis
MSKPKECFAKIIYINLDSRTDRKEHIESIIPFKERFSAIKDERGGYFGCVRSHIQCLKIAKYRRYESVIILEDDFKYAQWTSGYLIHQNFYDTLIACFEESLQALYENYSRENYLDIYWNKIIKDNLILKHKKIIGGQLENDFSDIKGCVFNRSN